MPHSLYGAQCALEIGRVKRQGRYRSAKLALDVWPGVLFENPVRGGVARELIGWRVAELTTVEAVRAAGGGAEDLARSWAAVEASGVGVELGSLPGETAPSDIAEAARAAVTAVFFPEG